MLEKMLGYRYRLGEHDRKIREFRGRMENNWKKVAGEMFVDSYDEVIDKTIADS